MDNTEIANRAYEQVLRVDKVIHLAVANDGNECTDDLRAFFDDSPEDVERLFKFDASDDELWVFLEHLVNERFDGFLICAAAPVRKYHPDGVGASLSWGYYRTRWLYAETYEEALEQAFAWAAEKAAEDRSKSEEADHG